MILYHFTSLYNRRNAGPDAILASGLKPKANDYNGMLPAPIPPTVWLTADPDPAIPIMSSYREVRITLAIPAAERRLVHWFSYLRRHLDSEGFDEFVRRIADEPYGPALVGAAERFYAFFGRIRPSKFRAVEYADPVRRGEANAKLSANGAAEDQRATLTR
jgi:hypothetical protein